MNYLGQTEAMHQQEGPRLGILLTNLGTPEAPTPQALRKYLRQFLSDPRVIELPRWQWWPILHGIILRVRPAKSAKLYAQVWTEAGSPLMTISRAQADALQTLLRAEGVDATVALAMRYGKPDIATALEQFQADGVRRVIVLPLYPQYAGATVGSTFDALAEALGRLRWVPGLSFINTYHDHPLYIDALVASLQEHFMAHGKPQRLLFSYHGMPERYLRSGDPYYCFCEKTTRLCAERLALPKQSYLTTYQSRFGREPWLKPYTDETLKQLAAEGVRKVAVICPGFSADCLETIEEIGVENREIFLAAGGEEYAYIAALNTREDHLRMMLELVRRYC